MARQREHEVQQRFRGRILTEAGKEKIKQAIRAWEFEHERRCTQEQLKELTGLDPSTSSKILNAKGGADRSKIEDLFRAFGLQLEESDLRSTLAITAPEPNPNFVGREDAIADLNTLIQRGAKLIVIQARGGVGKTTLAWEYLKMQGFDLVLELWMAKETQNIASVEGVLEEWLRRYFDEEPGREFGVTIERLRQKLRDPSQKIGILIDNLEPALDQSGKFIEAHRRYVELMRVLSDRAAQSVTLITSRERLQEVDFGIEHYLLRSLDQQAWQQFFEHHGIRHNESALAELHRAYGGNAKAMEILRSVVQADYGGDLAEYWQANQDDLFIERALEDLVIQQFDRLQQHDPNAYNLLCRMGCYRFQDVPTVPLEGLLYLLWDVPEKRQRRVIKTLQERALIEVAGSEYYLHPSVRVEAVARLKSPQDWESANRRAAEFWTESTQTVETVDDTLKAFEAYYHYVELLDFEQATQIVVKPRNNHWKCGITLGRLLYMFGMSQKMEGIVSLVSKVDPGYSQYKLYEYLGDLFWIAGLTPEAHKFYAQSVNVARKLNCKNLEVNALFNLGLCKIGIGEICEAHEHFIQLELISSQHPQYIEGVLYSWFCLALLKSYLGCQEEALYFANEYIKRISLETDNTRKNWDIWSTGYSFIFLGLTYINLEDQEKAFEMFSKAMEFAKQTGFVPLKANSLQGFAMLEREKGNLDAALAKNLEAVSLFNDVRAMCYLPEAYYQLGLTYNAMGDIEKSNKNFQQSVDLFTKMGALKQVERIIRLIKS